MLEPELLHTFVSIAETGRFTEAAKQVHRTQSAVSMQMKRLEEALGRALFARNGRTVQLTPDGELLLGHARRILRTHQEALAAFDDSDLEGEVRLGTTDVYATAFLPSILARFAETHPRVHVEIVCDLSVNLLARLKDNGLDLALVTHGHGNESGVVLLREPIVWVTSAHHCVHEQDPLPLALFHPGCHFRIQALEALSKQGRPFRVAYTSMSLTGILIALRASLAVSALPRSSVEEGLRILGEREGFPSLPAYQLMLQRARERTSPVLDHLEEYIQDSLSTAGPFIAAA